MANSVPSKGTKPASKPTKRPLPARSAKQANSNAPSVKNGRGPRGK